MLKFQLTLREGVCDRLPKQCENAKADYNQGELFRKG